MRRIHWNSSTVSSARILHVQWKLSMPSSSLSSSLNIKERLKLYSGLKFNLGKLHSKYAIFIIVICSEICTRKVAFFGTSSWSITSSSKGRPKFLVEICSSTLCQPSIFYRYPHQGSLTCPTSSEIRRFWTGKWYTNRRRGRCSQATRDFEGGWWTGGNRWLEILPYVQFIYHPPLLPAVMKPSLTVSSQSNTPVRTPYTFRPVSFGMVWSHRMFRVLGAKLNGALSSRNELQLDLWRQDVVDE